MDSELMTWLLLAACGAGFGAGAIWQTMRRRTAAPVRRRADRVASRARTPEAPEQPAEEKPVEQHGVLRPTMLALTTLQNSVTAADLFIQRALEIDEPHYRRLPATEQELRPLSGLFARNCALEWQPGDGLSRHTYALNFSSAIGAALGSGHMPYPNATANDLQIIALVNGAVPLGEPLPVRDFGVGAFPHVTELWMMCDPTDKKHELDDLLEYELDIIRGALPKVKLLVPAVRGLAWDRFWDQLFDLVRDVRRLGAEPGQAQERCDRTDALAKAMYEVNERIDKAVSDYAERISTPDEADAALTESIPLMLERELAVLFLRTLAVIRVISGDNYIHGMHCSAHIRSNVENFTDVHVLLDRARHIALDALETQSRGMSAPSLQAVGNLQRDADELAKAHDEAVTRLMQDVERLQTAIDRFLILQGRPRRFAVKMTDDNRVEALLVLEH